MQQSTFSLKFSRTQFNGILSCILGTLVFGFSTETLAQAGLLEEVIVTAQKREESIQDVGIAMTAFTGEQLDTFGFVSSTDLAAFTPGVHLSGNNAGNTLQFTIRGVTQSDFAEVLEGPNAVYVDGAYIATGQGQMFASYDTERVEILKGPQGTLFGRNATGGLVHYITRKPTDEFEAYVDTSYGSHNSVRFEGAVSGPISERVKARVSGFYHGFDPIWKNSFPAQLPPAPALFGPGATLSGSTSGASDLWEQDQFSVRGHIEFDIRDNVYLIISGSYAEQNPGAGPYQNVATVAFLDDSDGDGQVNNLVQTGFADVVQTTCEQININDGSCIDSALDLDFDGLRPGPTTDFFGYDDPDGDGDFNSTDHLPSDYDHVDVFSATAQLRWDINDRLSLTSITNFSEQDKHQSLDVDSGPAPQFTISNTSGNEWFTQELRLNGNEDRFKWVAGLYYLKINVKYIAGLSDTLGGLNVFGGSPSPFGAGNPFLNADAGLISSLDTESYSGFGQIEYELTDKTTFTVGARIIQEEKDFDYTNRLYPNLDNRTIDVNQAPVLIPPSVIIPGAGNTIEFFPPHSESTSKTLWSGKLGLNYAVNDDLMLYATINRGVKAGSFNAPLLTFLTPDQYGFKEEVLLAYEAGFKSTLWDGKARLNAGGYYYDYSDYQAFQFIGTSGAVFNVDAEYFGFEADLAVTPTENLEMVIGGSYIDATVKDLNVAPGLPRDVRPTFTPKFQASGLARYTWPGAIMGGDLAAQMDFNYASSAFFNINNFDTQKMPKYVVGNARVSWFSPDEHWEVQFFVNNLADARYQNIGFELTTICGCDERSFGLPRWFGGRVRYEF